MSLATIIFIKTFVGGNAKSRKGKNLMKVFSLSFILPFLIVQVAVVQQLVVGGGQRPLRAWLGSQWLLIRVFTLMNMVGWMVMMEMMEMVMMMVMGITLQKL